MDAVGEGSPRLGARGFAHALALHAAVMSGCASGLGRTAASASRGEVAPSELDAEVELERALGLAADGELQEARRAIAIARAAAATSEVRVEIELSAAQIAIDAREWTSAARALTAALAAMGPDDPLRLPTMARRCAVEAEAEMWEASAETARAIAAHPGASARQRVEAHARACFAHFQRDDLDAAARACAQAVAASAARDAGGPDLSGASREDARALAFFRGMAFFYEGAIAHHRFRALPLRLPEPTLRTDLERKVAALATAQRAYNDAIRSRHPHWISAAGLQLGVLLEEFHDAVMFAPVPEWLDARERAIYYDALRAEVTPVVDKAIWVFEQNIQAAHRLGYDNAFVRESQQRLTRLRAVLWVGATRPGQPLARLASDFDDEQVGGAPAVFIPARTPL